MCPVIGCFQLSLFKCSVFWEVSHTLYTTFRWNMKSLTNWSGWLLNDVLGTTVRLLELIGFSKSRNFMGVMILFLRLRSRQGCRSDWKFIYVTKDRELWHFCNLYMKSWNMPNYVSELLGNLSQEVQRSLKWLHYSRNKRNHNRLKRAE